jgi:hypothetical protein
MAMLGLSNEPRQEHAAYIQSWLKGLKNDKRLPRRPVILGLGGSRRC